MVRLLPQNVNIALKLQLILHLQAPKRMDIAIYNNESLVNSQMLHYAEILVY